MSAKNFMSSVLDELMGRNRNALPDEKPKQVSWDDPDICTHYLVCFCPNELFVNTKADLGPCTKLHDEQLRKRYQEEAPNIRKLQFEGEFIRFADKMVQDIEGKIKRGKMRIALANGPDGGTYAGPGSKNAEKIALLTERVNVLLQEAEEAGCAGDIEKTQGLLKLCDQLKEEREQLKSTEVNHPWNPDKAMQVCELLRKTMDDVKKARDARDIEERQRAETERKDRTERRWGRDNDNDREKRERPDREKERKRSRSRDRKKKDDKRKRSRSKSPRRRSRSRDRKDRKDKDEKKRDRDSSKDRKSRKHSGGDKDRDKEKKRSKRSRSRSKSRDRHRRKRSRSRDKGRDKDRSRSRSRSRKHKEDKERKDKEQPKSSTEDMPEMAPSKSPTLESPKLSPKTEDCAPTTSTSELIDDVKGVVDEDSSKSEEAEFQEAVKQFDATNSMGDGNSETAWQKPFDQAE